MDELINQVMKKAGISKNQAEDAIQAVMSFLDDRLPEPLAGQVDKVFKSGKGIDSLDDITDALGGLFGKK
jgi:hypothetical protein